MRWAEVGGTIPSDLLSNVFWCPSVYLAGGHEVMGSRFVKGGSESKCVSKDTD